MAAVTFCVYVISLLASLAWSQSTTVNLNIGTVIGFREDQNVSGITHIVKKFLGIPFAKPPIDHLRFRKPEPLEQLDTTPYNATYFRPFCVHGLDIFQPATGIEDEDCLYLNIYVPEQQADEETGHAVMIYIYGGSFIMGGADMFDGSPIAAAGNVIFVTFNYRLGLFGFLSTMDSNAPGNYGLFDQAMVFQWVHDNIVKFGGDASRVTVFGHSAGAMSAVIQGLYPGNYGNIHRIIAQSGTATTPYLKMSRDTLPIAKRFGQTMGCPTENAANMVECLRRIPWEQYKEKTASMINEMLTQVPHVDDDFIKTDPAKLSSLPDTQTGNEINYFRSLDYLSGVNAYDGGAFLTLLSGNFDLEKFQPTETDMESTLIPTTSMFVYDQFSSKPITKTILHEYTNWSNPTSFESVRLQFTNFLGDVIFVVPAIETARLHADDAGSGSTYVYHFLPAATNRIIWAPSWLQGANHADDVYFTFGTTEYLPLQWEKDLSMNMMKYWSNFAKTGNPNRPVDGNERWPEYGSSERYLELDKNNRGNSTRQYLGARVTDFWNDIIPQLTRGERNTTRQCPPVNGSDATVYTSLMLIVTCAVTWQFSW